MSDLKLGKYQHYKGNFYEVVGIGHHSETEEELVFYRTLYEHPKYGRLSWWVRPKGMFLETVTIDGRETPRFRFVGEVTGKFRLP